MDDNGNNNTMDMNSLETALPNAEKLVAAKKAADPNKKAMKVDVLPLMKAGSPFLKYGKKGSPHFRQFYLSEDNTTILWYSKNKKVESTKVFLKDITSLVFGQTTKTFAKHPAPDLNPSSFSLLYKDATLDLIAKDANEFRYWTKGLQKLIQIVKEQGVEGLTTLETLVLDLTVSRNKRSSLCIVDAVTGEKALEKFDPKSTNRFARMGEADQKDFIKMCDKRVIELRSTIAKIKDDIRKKNYLACKDYQKMLNIIEKADESESRVTEWVQKEMWESVDDECWRTQVDLDALKNMMKAENVK